MSLALTSSTTDPPHSEHSALHTIAATLRQWAPVATDIPPPTPPQTSLPPPLFAVWDSLPSAHDPSRYALHRAPCTESSGVTHAPRLLIVAYPNAHLLVWLHSLQATTQLLHIQDLAEQVPHSLRPQFSDVGEIVAACVLPSVLPAEDGPAWRSEVLLAILTTTQEFTTNLLLYSLDSHAIVHALSFPGIGTRIVAHGPRILLSTVSPSRIHVLASATLLPEACSPIKHLAQGSHDGAPVWDLGTGGRLLAFATDLSPVASSLVHPRPGYGIRAAAGVFEAECDDEEGAAGGMGEEVVRYVGENVRSGVKALGDMGKSYWATRQSYAVAGEEVGYSKSAPTPGFARAGDRRRTSNPSLPAPTLKRDARASAGTILVLDLASLPPASSPSRLPRPAFPPTAVIAHFRISYQPIALLSFSPFSALLLAADLQARYFDIFELRPDVPGRLDKEREKGTMWHRYRAERGLTNARAELATWDSEGRFVAVGTGKGTHRTSFPPICPRTDDRADVFALQPFGGAPNLSDHFALKISDSLVLPELSLPLSAIARVRPTPLVTGGVAEIVEVSTGPLCWIPKRETLSSTFLAPASPAPSPSKSTHPGSQLSPSPSFPPRTNLQDLLLFTPHSSTAVMHRLALMPPSMEQDVGRLAGQAVSGLSNLMRSRGIGAVTGGGGGERKEEWSVGCTRKAEWSLALLEEDREVLESIPIPEERGNGAAGGRGSYCAQVEIETFSRSPHILPKSIDLSSQFEFYALPPSSSSLSPSSAPPRMINQIQVRPGVQIVSGSPTHSNPSYLAPHSSAMLPISSTSVSPSRTMPISPNGLPGKRGGWKETLQPLLSTDLSLLRRSFPLRAAFSPSDKGAMEEACGGVSFESCERDDFSEEGGVGGPASVESGSTDCTSECDDGWEGEGEIKFDDDEDFGGAPLPSALGATVQGQEPQVIMVKGVEEPQTTKPKPPPSVVDIPIPKLAAPLRSPSPQKA